MKNYILIAVAVIIVSVCKQAELDKLSHEKEALLAVVGTADFLTGIMEDHETTWALRRYLN